MKSNFTLGLGYGISLQYFNNNEAEVIIEHSTLSNKTAQYGRGALISRFSQRGSIEFHNCIAYNNTAQYNVRGVYIIFHKDSGSIDFGNWIIHNNNTQLYGGGVYILVSSYRSGSIEFSKCTIYNNNAYNESRLFLIAC